MNPNRKPSGVEARAERDERVIPTLHSSVESGERRTRHEHGDTRHEYGDPRAMGTLIPRFVRIACVSSPPIRPQLAAEF